jgi:hypothetical protein
LSPNTEALNCSVEEFGQDYTGVKDTIASNTSLLSIPLDHMRWITHSHP